VKGGRIMNHELWNPDRMENERRRPDRYGETERKHEGGKYANVRRRNEMEGGSLEEGGREEERTKCMADNVKAKQWLRPGHSMNGKTEEQDTQKLWKQNISQTEACGMMEEEDNVCSVQCVEARQHVGLDLWQD